MKTIIFDSLTSTNEYAKEHDDGGDFVVSANVQTGGKGTKGRSFLSERGGVYLTLVRHPNLTAGRAFQIMINACVAVCRTVENYNIPPRIRWPNDVLVGDKKISGTLIENTFSGDRVSRSIVGIGLNVNNHLADEIADIATTMAKEGGTSLSVEEVRSTLINNLQKEYTVSDYKRYIDWLGSEVSITAADQTFRAVAEDVSEDGRLLVTVNGKKQKISSGEVTLRLTTRKL
jgi:BirA family biotin operon repressor/biotin-[acetyl-CoA-carboxylase] ligase